MRPPDSANRSARQVVKVIKMEGVVLFIVDYLCFNRGRHAVARSHGDSGKAQLATAVPTFLQAGKMRISCGFIEIWLGLRLVKESV
jgi:hypothetical protein